MGPLSTYYNYSNSYSYPIVNNSQINTFQPQQEIFALQQEELAFQFQQQNQDFSSSSSSYLDENFILQSPYFFSNETCPSFDDQLFLDSIFSYPNEQDFNNNNNDYSMSLKRQKLCYDEKIEQQQQQEEEGLVWQNSSNFFVDEFFSNPFASFEAEYYSRSSASKCEGITDVSQCDQKKINEERTVSTHSITARERRRKISEKTQELGKLVPGGPKMNTAEMLNAAANYVKFLQAQVGMLELMETLSKEENEAPPSEDLNKLVVCPFIQEKLYSEEKCFVPKEIVTTLTNYDDVLSKPTILKGLQQLIGTEINEKRPKQ